MGRKWKRIRQEALWVKAVFRRSSLSDWKKPVAVLRQIQLIQNDRTAACSLKGEGLQTRCARVHHGAALVQHVLHADGRSSALLVAVSRRYARSAGTGMPPSGGGVNFSEVTGMMPGIIGISTPAGCRIDQGAVAFILEELT